MQVFEKLEEKFGEWIDNNNCVAVSSGTSALHIACEVMSYVYSMGEGARIIIPEFTMVACPRATVMARFKPEFRDCSDNLLIEEFNPNRMPVMPVHIYGRRVDVGWFIMNGCEVIEDLAEGHGINPHPRSFAACWSFYKNKIIHGEEGGMIAFRESEHAQIARELRSLGFDSNHNFLHRPRGVNARMSNLHAEPILKSLLEVGNNLEWRRKLKQTYDSCIPEEWEMPDTRQVDWVYDLRIPGLKSSVQDLIVRECRNRGLEARHGFKPCSLQKEYGGKCEEGLNALRLSQEVMYLPIHDQMTEHEVRHFAKTFLDVCRGFGIHPE